MPLPRQARRKAHHGAFRAFNSPAREYADNCGQVRSRESMRALLASFRALTFSGFSVLHERHLSSTFSLYFAVAPHRSDLFPFYRQPRPGRSRSLVLGNPDRRPAAASCAHSDCASPLGLFRGWRLSTCASRSGVFLGIPGLPDVFATRRIFFSRISPFRIACTTSDFSLPPPAGDTRSRASGTSGPASRSQQPPATTAMKNSPIRHPPMIEMVWKAELAAVLAGKAPAHAGHFSASRTTGLPQWRQGMRVGVLVIGAHAARNLASSRRNHRRKRRCQPIRRGARSWPM